MQKWFFSAVFLLFGLSSFQNANAGLGFSPLPIGSPAQSPEMVVTSVLEKNKVPEPLSALILSQAKLESGHFSSDVYNLANNPFGMRPARVRKHKACGQYNGYAAYESLAHAVEDYILWMEAVCIPLHITEADVFVRFLQSKGYFEADPSTYLRHLRRLLRAANHENVIA